MTHTIHTGDSAETLKQYPDNHFDSIVTDPPYGIEFLGKDWDSNTGAISVWRECLRVLKPGGFLLAFSAARTYHHLATNIESVGFEIRDQLMWIYASGFPKAQDIGKSIQRRQGVEKTKKNLWASKANHRNKFVDNENPGERKITGRDVEATPGSAEEVIPTSAEALQWAGWKTALKPGHEPIVMARKPFKGSTIDNVLEHGVGALNIDASRIPYDGANDKPIPHGGKARQHKDTPGWMSNGTGYGIIENPEINPIGRFPSNVFGEIPDYQKYFYCPKVSRKERHCGFEAPANKDWMVEEMGGHWCDDGKGNQMMIDLPHKGKIYVHGLKHEYEEWCQKNKRDSLAHIPTGNNIGDGVYAPGTPGPSKLGDSAPRGERRCSKNAHERWHQGMEHKKGGRLDPLAQDINPKDGLPKRICKGGGDEWVQAQPERAMNVGNNHPTVKPVALMRYLIQLVTPPNSRVLDPFCGSGSTGMAARELGHEFVGSEQNPDYVTIADRRITGWLNTQGQPHDPTHIPAPFGSVKGCYDQGERFAARHQQLQQPHNETATTTRSHRKPAGQTPFERLFE